MSPVEKAIWITVLVACMTGGLAFAMWYARRWKARGESAASTKTTVVPDYERGEPYGDLPHMWTFANGLKLYTNIQIVACDPYRVKLAGGGVVTSEGSVSAVNFKKEHGLVLTGGPNDPHIMIGSSSFKNSKIIIK